jgi:aryl-alcohol dehydrogenase-like predicted oxidoreductase
MQMRRFGNTPLEVSAISLGCWIFGVDWWGHYSEEDCLRLCKFSYDLGITFFDNGDAYGNGRAETLFASFLKTVPREKVQVGGKFGYDFYNDPGEAGSHLERRQDFSPAFMRKALEQSLRRLGTDYLDLYMAHNIKLPQFRDDLFAELEKVKDEGKIKVWGVSLGPAIGWREEGIEAMTKHHAKAVQTVYNLFEQNPGMEFSQTAHATRAGVLARVHDNSSILKDIVKIDTEIANNDHRKFRDQSWKIYGLKKLEMVRPYALDHGMTVHQLACKWLLMDSALTSITGTLLNELEVKEAADSIAKPDLNPDDMRELADMYANDFGLGGEAHPCDLKSSTDPTGRVRSGYVAPNVLLAGSA